MLMQNTLDWNTLAAAKNAHILQTAEWGELKRAFGWQNQIVQVDQLGGALILYKPLPLRLPGSLAYIPRGPVVDWNNERAMKRVFAEVIHTTYAHRAFALKIEPDLP